MARRHHGRLTVNATAPAVAAEQPFTCLHREPGSRRSELGSDDAAVASRLAAPTARSELTIIRLPPGAWLVGDGSLVGTGRPPRPAAA